jgi:hypothetical protein
MDKEIQHRMKIGELEAKLNNLKVKRLLSTQTSQASPLPHPSTLLHPSPPSKNSRKWK